MQTTTEHYKPGDIIIEEGQPSTKAFYITSGCVEILMYKDEKILTLARLGPGEIFGETALFGDKVYGATVKAKDPTDVEVMTNENLKTVLSNTDPIIEKIIKALIHRQNQTNKDLLKSETREFIDVDLI